MTTLKPLLHINNLSAGYHKQLPLLKNIRLTAQRGELITLIGLNGAGKTTLLKTIAGQMNPLEGTIFLDDKNIKDYSSLRLSKLLTYASTERFFSGYMKVIDVVSLGRFPHNNRLGISNRKDREKVLFYLDSAGLSGYAYRNIDELSDGEVQRVMLAKILAQETDLALLDEPTAFLDILNKNEITGLLKKLSEKTSKTIIFSTHDLALALKISDKIWLLNGHQIIEGAPEDLLLNGSFKSIYEKENYRFDPITGEIDFPARKKRIIHLFPFPDEKYYLLTKKALERNGFKAANQRNAHYSIKIKKNQNQWQWQWIILKNNDTFVCNSIYELIQKIKLWHED